METMYMNTFTGEVASYDEWFYNDGDGVTVNAVDRNELVAVVKLNEQWTSLTAVVFMMDDEIREHLHAKEFDSEQDFVDAYVREHHEQFNEDFVV